ncbi:MAG: MFS transporter [Azospirillaceae bacterium]
MTHPVTIITVAALTGFLVVAQLYLPLPLLGDIAEAHDVSLARAGLVSSVFGFAYAAGFLIFGPASDRLGRRPVMIGGLAALSVASLVVILMPGWGSLLGARAVQGIVAAALPPVALAYLGEVLPPARRVTGIAWMSTAFLVAGLAGQVYGDFAGGLAAAIGPLALAYGVAAVAIARLPAAPGPEGAGRADRSPLSAVLVLWRSLPSILTRAPLLPAYGAALVLLMSFVAFYTGLSWMRDDALASAGLDLFTARLVALPAMFLTLGASRLVARVGARQVVSGGLALAAVGAASAAIAPGVSVLVAASVVFVAGIAVTVPSLIALIGSLEPERRGAATALYTFTLFVGASLGPQIPALVEPAGFTGLCSLLAALLAGGALINTPRAVRAIA